MYSEIFQTVGLSPNEAKIYESLLSTGESSVSDISARAHIHRRNVYDTLNRLQEKGLVFVIFQKGENRFQAVHPNKMMEILKEKETSLERVLPQLRTLYAEETVQEAAYIYKGLEGFKNYMRDVARVGEDTYFWGAKGLWFTPGIDKGFLKDFQTAMDRKKKNYKTLYDPRVPVELPQALVAVRGEYKILPDKYPTPGVVDIFGDYVVTFTSAGVGNFGEDGSIFVMINRELAETYRTWFHLVWDMLPEKK